MLVAAAVPFWPAVGLLVVLLIILVPAGAWMVMMGVLPDVGW